MLTYQTTLTDTPTDDEVADWTQRREALRIRPLIEFPALRAAMGLANFPTPVATGAAHQRAAKRRPQNTSAPATNTRSKTSAKGKAAEGRFDRRTLLEFDR